MMTMYKEKALPITKTKVHIVSRGKESGYCIWCNVHMHSQSRNGKWYMYCYKKQSHKHPICKTQSNNKKTVLEWRCENWDLIFGSMDHEDPLKTKSHGPTVEPPPTDVPYGIDTINPNPDSENYDLEDDNDDDNEDPNEEDIDIDTIDPGPAGHEKREEEIKIIHRPPRTMREVVLCGVLFLVDLGALFANGTRIGDRITSYIDRKWMFIAIFAELLHIRSSFLSIPSPNSYHAFQFVPTRITRDCIEGSLSLYYLNQRIYINLEVHIDPTLPKDLMRQLGNTFIELRKKCLEPKPTPKNENDHFLAFELLVVSGRWEMIIPPHKSGDYLRTTFKTTIRSEDQLALCKGAMKWLKSQGENFYGLSIK